MTFFSGIANNSNDLKDYVSLWEDVLGLCVSRLPVPSIEGQDNIGGNSECTIFDLISCRRWNSFYPTYFDSYGGGYVVRAMYYNSELSVAQEDYIVVDPGFNFLRLMRTSGLDPNRISSVIITHYHPDHVGNLIEFFLLLSKIDPKKGKPISVFLNETTYEAVKNELISANMIRVYNIGSDQCYSVMELNDWRKTTILLHTKKAYHWEIGGMHNSLSFKLEFESKNEGFHPRWGFTGDTDGAPCYIEEYIRNFSDCDIVVAHVGSWRSKQFKGDKHLYEKGIKQLIRGLHGTNRLFLLSEFGLEMADPFTLGQSFESLLEMYSEMTPRDKNNARKNLCQLFEPMPTIIDLERKIKKFSESDKMTESALTTLEDITNRFPTPGSLEESKSVCENILKSGSSPDKKNESLVFFIVMTLLEGREYFEKILGKIIDIFLDSYEWGDFKNEIVHQVLSKKITETKDREEIHEALSKKAIEIKEKIINKIDSQEKDFSFNLLDLFILGMYFKTFAKEEEWLSRVYYGREKAIITRMRETGESEEHLEYLPEYFRLCHRVIRPLCEHISYGFGDPRILVARELMRGRDVYRFQDKKGLLSLDIKGKLDYPFIFSLDFKQIYRMKCVPRETKLKKKVDSKDRQKRMNDSEKFQYSIRIEQIRKEEPPERFVEEGGEWERIWQRLDKTNLAPMYFGRIYNTIKG